MQLSAINEKTILDNPNSIHISNTSYCCEEILNTLESFGLKLSQIIEGWFVTPIKVHIWPVIWEWYKDFSSGRSFQISFREEDWSISTLINKWNDIFEDGDYRRFSIKAWTFVWQEMFGFLYPEFLNAKQIQQKALSISWKTTFAPIPISLSKTKNIITPDWTSLSYKEYFQYVIKNFPEYKEWFLYVLCNFFIPIGVISTEDFLDITLWDDEKLMEILKKIDMWNYIYLLKWFNTRLVEHKKIGKRKLDFVLKNEYPECVNENWTLNKENIIKEFCKRMWENLWITYSVGLSYKRNSECVLIDTTIWWNSVDNGHLWKWLRKKEIQRRILEIYSTCLFFAKNVLDIDLENFDEIFKSYFINELIKFSWWKMKIIENALKWFNLEIIKLSTSFYIVNNLSRKKKISWYIEW